MIHRLTTFVITLALMLPVVSMVGVKSAEAGIFGTLSSSRKSGKRTHKKASKSSKSDDDRSSRSSKRSTKSKRAVRSTTRRTSPVRKTNVRSRRTTRSSSHRTSSGRTVKNKRPKRRVVSSSRSTRHASHRHRSSRTVRRHNHRTRTHRSRSTAYRSRSTTTHHHHNTRSSRRGYASRSGGSSTDVYATVGLGLSGLASPEITDLPLPGAGYNVAIGAKNKWFGGELGVNGGGYTFSPGEMPTDIQMIGLSGDLKFQPTIGFFEPYVLAGVGGYAMSDRIVDEAATGAALRLGFGADFRFDDVALSARYLHSSFGFQDVNGIYDGRLNARTETLGLNLSVYF